MKVFKRTLDILIGAVALLILAVIIFTAFGVEFSFISSDIHNILTKIVYYAFPILIGIVCVRFTCDKVVWFVLTIVFAALALWIYFDAAGFFAFIHSIFG